MSLRDARAAVLNAKACGQGGRPPMAPPAAQ